MDLGLAGKAAAVMAGSDGIGRACATALAREGADVAICARREDVLRATAKDIADATGRRVIPVRADVGVAQDVTRFIDAAARELGGLDVLVVNGGGPPAGGFERIDDGQWQAAFDATLLSATRAVRAALPHFRARGAGSVVGVSSTSVRQPIDELVLSNSIRMAVHGLFKSLALEYGPEKIRFNLVMPGGVATERLRELTLAQATKSGITEEEQWAKRTRSTPLGRIGEPAEIADAVCWLASERARYVTGVSLAVDGGLIRAPF